MHFSILEICFAVFYGAIQSVVKQARAGSLFAPQIWLVGLAKPCYWLASAIPCIRGCLIISRM